MTSGVPGQGPIVDACVIEKRIGRLIRFIRRNQVSKWKTLSTTILADLTALNVSLQAATDVTDLAINPTLPIRDTQDQTGNLS